jgi:hypothetical protein
VKRKHNPVANVVAILPAARLAVVVNVAKAATVRQQRVAAIAIVVIPPVVQNGVLAVMDNAHRVVMAIALPRLPAVAVTPDLPCK